jgi:hypothetical protein
MVEAATEKKKKSTLTMSSIRKKNKNRTEQINKLGSE